MFDGIDAGANSGLDAFGAFGVSHYFFARAVGYFHGFGHLFGSVPARGNR